MCSKSHCMWLKSLFINLIPKYDVLIALINKETNKIKGRWWWWWWGGGGGGADLGTKIH